MLAEAANTAQITEAIQKGFTAKYGRTCPIFATHAAAAPGPKE